MVERPSRLPETLSALIAERGYARNRRPILDAVDVSAAALSQYARGTTTPTLQRLMALADFFEVSLDHLVYGTPQLTPGAPQPAELRLVQDAFVRTQASAAAHSALVGRVGRHLSDRIDAVAREIADEYRTSEGLVDDAELLRLESRSLRADVVTIDLDANVTAMPDGETAAGGFLEAVAVAIERGCRYRFVVSSHPRTRDDSIRGFLNLLTERVGPQRVERQCPVRRATVPTLVGMGLYQLDRNALRAEDPAILTQFADSVSDDDWFGYLIRPQPAAGKDSVMHPRRRETARALFEVLWETGTAVR